MTEISRRFAYRERLRISDRYTAVLHGGMVLVAVLPADAEPEQEQWHISLADATIGRLAQAMLEWEYKQEQKQKRPLRQAQDKVQHAAAHDVEQPTFYRRQHTSPEDWATAVGLPNAVSIMPARAMSWEADVQAPLLQAAISGGVVAVSVWVVGASFKYFFGLPLSYLELVIPSGLAAVGVGAWMWFKALWRNRIGMWAFETAVNMDLDGDGEVGEPGIRPRTVTVNRGDYSEQIPINARSDGPTRKQWQMAAVALLVNGGNVSRRGLYQNSDLSQSQAAEIATILHETGRAVDGVLNLAGFNYLESFLPEHAIINSPYPAA